ncbi:lysophospholipase [Streptomyces sp. NBC_01218]|uniref:alpha/beta hydrolase n=1 Tax=unclassified Streptomyces TaxID=2593676 RepID=UPI0023B8A878|nr:MULTISPECIES: alpha/beta fold hydrolase [unclassified Streptomyces]WEH40477.1 alpha/beta fold hydrolase [Streptomyces sp. AM 2-1-1]WSQ52169.1 lysophospholipase [Streptomyces sp. NBC_01218]
MTAAPVAPPPRRPAGPRHITLHADGVPLSARLAEPADGLPRATVVALHGAGMSAGYFDGPAHPETSLLTVAAELGYTAVAIDRPGYGASAGRLPHGQSVTAQAATLAAALRDVADRYGTGAGIFLMGHSFGSKPALQIAADGTVPGLFGLDLSGCGAEYVVSPTAPATRAGNWKLNWGPLRLYPPGTFRSSIDVVSPAPVREMADAEQWPAVFAALAGRVRVPVRFTFAEHEAWWRRDQQALTLLRKQLVSSPRVLIDHQPDAGHNISLGWAARAYHLRALGFAEECLRQRPTRTE